MAQWYNFLKRLRFFVSSGIMSEYLDNPLSRQQPRTKTITDSASVQSDVYDVAARKRVAVEFEQQWESMHIRSLKRHSASCKDPLTCTKKNCFKIEPDKIIKTKKVKRARTVGVFKGD